jgi:hypothetical protein
MMAAFKTGVEPSLIVTTTELSGALAGVALPDEPAHANTSSNRILAQKGVGTFGLRTVQR